MRITSTFSARSLGWSSGLGSERREEGGREGVSTGKEEWWRGKEEYGGRSPTRYDAPKLHLCEQQLGVVVMLHVEVLSQRQKARQIRAGQRQVPQTQLLVLVLGAGWLVALVTIALLPAVAFGAAR